MKKSYAEISLIIIVALWGLSFSLTKPLLSKVGVFNFLTYRFLIGGLMLMFILAVTKNLKFNKSLVKSGIVSGVLLFVAFYGHMEGLKHTTVAKNAFIVGSSVIFIPILIYLLQKKKSSYMTLLQTTLAVLGLAMITLVSMSVVNKGDIITLFGTAIYALYTIKVEKSVREHRTDVFTAVQLTTVGILSLVATLLFETPTMDFTPNEWLSIAFLSIVLTGFFYYLLNNIQSVLSASNVTLIFTFEPFFATLFGWLFLKEAVGMNVFIGGALIIFSVLLPYIKSKSRKGVIYEV